jgi:hypothetical protein
MKSSCPDAGMAVAGPIAEARGHFKKKKKKKKQGLTSTKFEGFPFLDKFLKREFSERNFSIL